MHRFASVVVLCSIFLGGCATSSEYKSETPQEPSTSQTVEEATAITPSGTLPEVVKPSLSNTMPKQNVSDSVILTKNTANTETSKLPFDSSDTTDTPTKDKNFELIVTTVSRHNGVRNSSRDWWKECDRKRPNGKAVYNECNWGLGIRYYHNEGWLGGKHFSDAISMKNSLEGRLNMVGTGVLYDIGTVGNFTFTASASVLAGHYTRRFGKSDNLGALAFETGVQYKKIFSTNVSCIPRVTFKQFVVCNLNFRFPFSM